jgi:ABC-2 type transport system permease protein
MIHRALLRLTWRQYLGRHRLGLLLFLSALGALPVVIAAVTLEVGRLDLGLGREEFLKGLFWGFQLPLLYPVIALILTATVLREEIQNETIPYLWLKPIPRGAIVVSKYLGVLMVALLFSGLSLIATAALLVDDWGLIGSMLLVMAVALLAYGAFFLALSTLFDRALIWGFVYVLIWEGSFSRISPAASKLSIRHYAEDFLKNLLDLPAEVSLVMSLGVLLGLMVMMLGLACWRFARMEFPGGMEE